MALNLAREFGSIAKTCGGVDLMKASWNKMRDMDSQTKACRKHGGPSFPVMTKDDWRWVVFYALGFKDTEYDSVVKRAKLAREDPVWDALYHLVSFKGFDASTGDKMVSLDRLGYTNAILFLIAYLDERDRQSALDDMFPDSLRDDESAILCDMLTEINKMEKRAQELHRRLSVPKRVIPIVRPITPPVEAVEEDIKSDVPIDSSDDASTPASDASQVDSGDFLTLEAEIAGLDADELESLVDKLPFVTACNLRKLLNDKFAAVM